jgi:hypothetical protein
MPPYNPWGAMTPDANGYMPQMQMQEQVNPYAQGIASSQNQMGYDQNQMQQQGPQMQGMMGSQMTQMQNYAGASSPSQSYPSYPNAAGAGNQMGMNIPQMQPPTMLGSGQQGNGGSMNPTTGSQAFNPWSLSGEAMSRTK